MNRLAIKTFFILALVINLGGCAGYQLGAVKPSAFSEVNRIFVPPFKNETLEPRISTLVTNAVIKEMQADGTYLLSNRANADAVLTGSIKEIDKNQLRSVRTDTLQSRELGVHLHIKWQLTDPNTGREIGTKPAIAEPADFDRSSTIRVRPGVVVGETIQFVDPNFQVSERNAIAIAAEDAARKLVGQLSNGW